MKIYTEISDLRDEHPNIVFALGMFDGVHRGHQAILRKASELAHSIKGEAAAFTFSSHPLSVVAPDRAPTIISDDSMKLRLLEIYGMDFVVDIPFDRDFSLLEPSDFLDFLQNKYSPRYVVAGANYTFGVYGRGTSIDLEQYGYRYGFHAEIADAVNEGGEPVSSTRVRECIAHARLKEANSLLGRDFSYDGIVQHGDMRGRLLGFPTANITIGDGRAMLPNGAYAVRILLEDHATEYRKFLEGGSPSELYGIANVGANPTFKGVERRIEVHVFDFNGDLYGRHISVSFSKRLRDEKRFPSADALVHQLNIDRDDAMNFFRG